MEAALDELYGVDPAEFVAIRKRLAADLRASGERDAAKELAAARRPTQAAARLNEVARSAPSLVASLLDDSDTVRRAQTGGGAQAEVRAAIQAQREAVAELVTAAAPSSVSDAVRTEVVAIVHAAAVDPVAAELLQSGRLVRVPEPSSGLGDVWSAPTRPRSAAKAEARSTSKSKPKSRSRSKSTSTTDEDDATRRAARADTDARAKAAQAHAQAELDEASAALDATADAWAEADRRVEQTKLAAEAARTEAAEAKRAHAAAARLVRARTKALELASRRLSS